MLLIVQNLLNVERKNGQVYFTTSAEGDVGLGWVCLCNPCLCSSQAGRGEVVIYF